MKLNDLIMSKRPVHRILRHSLFWLTIYAPSFGVTCIAFLSYDYPDVPHWSKLFSWQLIYLTYFAVNIVFSYIVVYYLMPQYLYKKRFRAFTGWVLLLLFAAYTISGVLVIGQFSNFRDYLLLDMWKHFQVFINSGPIIRCALFLFAKELKNYHLQMEERVSLIRENGKAELQLLKAQVHPHFLFNTLNNIYSFTLNKSPYAAQLLSKLSATVKYMITDCEAPVVSLEKEIKMLKDYISLEKVRYGNGLRLELSWPGNTGQKQITPLLLIPFIENSFKHGTCKMLESPWVELKIDVVGNELFFYLSNSKPGETSAISGKSGIGLKNVRKRLELLYPGEYTLNIAETADTFTVEMKVPLLYEGEEFSAKQRSDKLNGALIGLNHV